MPSAFVQWMQQHQRPISYVDDTDRLGQARQRLGIKVSAPPVEPPPAPPATPPSLDDGMVLNGQNLGRYRDVPFADSFQEAGSKYGVDPALLMAITQQESGFNPNARGGAGEMGLMQFMVPTWNEQNPNGDAWDPHQNIMTGAKYVKWLTDYTGGNTEDVLRAYNSGPGTWKRGGYPEQTRTYVQNVLRYYDNYR